MNRKMMKLCFLVLTLIVWNREVLCMGGAEEMKALHQMLFANYSPTVRPSRDYSRPTVMTLQLYIGIVIGLETRDQLLHFKGFMKATWNDELLRWNPDDYGGIKDIMVPQAIIWNPDVYLSNAASDIDYMGGSEVLLVVSSSGYVRWEPGLSAKTTCKVDVTRYPFDVNLCSISFVTWMHPNISVKMVWPSKDPVDLSTMVTNGEFEIESGGVDIYTNYFPEIQLHYEVLSFNVKLTRRPAYIIMSVVLPITMLALLSIISYIMAPEEPERVTVSMTVLLSFTVFLNVIDSSIPQTSDHLSLLLVYVTAMVGQAFLTVIGNVLVLTVSGWDEKRLKTSRDAGATEDQSEPYINSVDAGKSMQDHVISKNSSGEHRYPPEHSVKAPVATSRAFRLNKFLLALNCSLLVLITSIMVVLMFA